MAGAGDLAVGGPGVAVALLERQAQRTAGADGGAGGGASTVGRSARATWSSTALRPDAVVRSAEVVVERVEDVGGVAGGAEQVDEGGGDVGAADGAAARLELDGVAARAAADLEDRARSAAAGRRTRP